MVEYVIYCGTHYAHAYNFGINVLEIVREKSLTGLNTRIEDIGFICFLIKLYLSYGFRTNECHLMILSKRF